VQPLRQGQ